MTSANLLYPVARPLLVIPTPRSNEVSYAGNSNINDLIRYVEQQSYLTAVHKRVLTKRINLFPEDDEIAAAQAEIDAEAAVESRRLDYFREECKSLRELTERLSHERDEANKQRDEAIARMLGR
jgi:hypothetical protein